MLVLSTIDGPVRTDWLPRLIFQVQRHGCKACPPIWVSAAVPVGAFGRCPVGSSIDGSEAPNDGSVDDRPAPRTARSADPRESPRSRHAQPDGDDHRVGPAVGPDLPGQRAGQGSRHRVGRRPCRGDLRRHQVRQTARPGSEGGTGRREPARGCSPARRATRCGAARTTS